MTTADDSPEASPLKSTALTLRRVLSSASAPDPLHRLSPTSAIQLGTSIAADLIDLIDEVERKLAELKHGLDRVADSLNAPVADRFRVAAADHAVDQLRAGMDWGTGTDGDVANRWEC